MTFAPQISPEDMLASGVFGGNYFANATDADFEGMRPSIVLLAALNQRPFDKTNNRYEARAGESYDAWKANGWIFDEDPLGWFHWYCRYDSGRRHPRDAHQINRWLNYGKRWGRFGRTQVYTKGDASSVVKQGLLQWAYEPMAILHGVQI